MLHLTTGTTSPAFPNQPITGSRGTLEGAGKGKIVKIKGNSLVDNNFAVPRRERLRRKPVDRPASSTPAWAFPRRPA